MVECDVVVFEWGSVVGVDDDDVFDCVEVVEDLGEEWN